ncbi:mucin-binding protein [Streptococcus mitis]|uniref:mucin-binding protein n=1 Tax=Streptococcus mitis TaxID=28037 RepID=UPI0021B4DC24|nr:MucBP domain-containing protein [Streptococcus mitis]
MYSRTEKYHGRRAQRFSIRKYSFGAASVLLGTALLLGANAVKADETNVATTKAPEITNPDKQKPDSAITTPVVEELPELKLDAVKADEKPEVKDDAKTEATPVAEKEVTDKVEKEKSDKEQADKKEVDKEKAETVKPKDEVKSVLTQLTSEAEVMATVASNFSDKEVKDVEAKQKLSAAIAAVKLEAVAAKGLLYSNDSTEEQLTAQVNRISSAIEAVYAEMKRAGHADKVEAVLGATDTKDQTITGKGVVRNGNAIVTVNNAYVTMNADNTKPKAWGINVVFDTSQAQNGDTTTIELKNLAGLGDSFKPNETKIKASDGTVIGVVTKLVSTNSTGSRGGESPFWSQRKKDGKTYQERLTEQPAIPNEVGSTTYTITWNDKAKNYAVTTFYAENLTAAGYVAPDIVEDKDYTASISVNGQKILEHTYTHKATKPNAQKQNTSATLMGDNILGYKGNEIIRKSDAIVINTDSDVRYGTGSKFKITLPNDEFNYFRKIDGAKDTLTNTEEKSITYRPANRWSNVQANENNVWILNDGRDTDFTLKATVKSPTELEIEVIDGAIQEGSVLSMDLAKLGVEKVITNRTFSDEYSKFKYNELGKIQKGSVVGDIDKTAATLTVSGGTPLNGGEENITTKVANGWIVDSYPLGDTTNETGAVTITLVNIETGEEIAYEPTSYDGFAKPNEDGSYETKNILGKKYDVSNELPDLTKTINGIEYIRVDVPAKGTTGTVNIGPKRASAIYSSEELQANGVNPNAFVNNVVYYYVKKTKVEEVNRTIKYVYADDVKDLAGQQVFEPTKQTVSYTGTIQVNDKNEAQVDTNRKPIYINWVGNGDTNLPELAVPKKEGYIASVEKVPVQATTATDEDYEYVVTYTAIQKAKTTFIYQDKDGNAKEVEGNTPVTETGKGGDKLTKAEVIAEKIKEAQNKGYELVSNTYPEGGEFDKDANTDQEFTVTLKERVVPVTPDQPKTPGTPVDPNNPDGPKYPAGLEEKDLNKTVTRTITYVYADGTPVLNEDGTPKVVTQEAKFTREAKVNLVTDEVTYGDWTPAQDLTEVKSPEIAKHTVDKATVGTVQVTNSSENINEVVTYTPVQKATTTFVYQDKDGNVKQVEGNEPISETGTNGDKLTKAEVIAAKIKEAQNKGYELVSNTYPTDGVFDKDVNTDQEFTVTFKERVVPVTPDQPKTPGTPVDPNNPDGPKYPAGLEEKDLNKTVTRTITYVYEDGTPVLNEDGTPKTVTQETKFTREAKVNLVTGEVTYGDWTPAQDLAEVKSPVVPGYLADKASVPVVNVTADSKDTTEVVTYKPLGSWVPNIPGQPTNPIKYPNDPTDPTTPGNDKPVLPYVPGMTPKDKDGNPLKPVDPNDPTKGYEVPNVPTNPGEDTPINYVKDTQKAKTTFVDEKGNPIPGVDAITEEGDSDTPLTKEADVKAKIKELENKGYELVSNTYPEGGKFDKDKDTDQEFKVTLKAKVVTVTPDQPKTPGTPVDPNNPDGPKYPAGLEEKDLNKTVTRTITYVYEDGTPVLNEDGTPKTVTQEAKFTREAKVNLVTGEVTYGDWTPEQDLAEVKSPVVKGFVADKATVATTKVTADSEDTTEVVTYKPLGSWVPNIPGQPTNPIKYPNDPADPTKPGSDKPVLPYVPGHTPVDGNGQPLKPVDPKDPAKGYEVPNVPTNPGEDTPINYVANKANLVVKYVDENGKELLPSETTEGKVGDEYATSGKVITGYVLERVEGEAKGKIGENGTTVTYVYKPLGSWIPNIPGQPTNPIKYPNDPVDPTKPGSDKPVLPYVPGHTPVDGNGQPLKPVDPKDPAKGYEVPNVPTNPGEDTPINYISNSPKPNPTPYPGPTPAPTPKPEPKPEPAPVPTTPETPEQPVAPVQPEQPTTPTQPAVPTPAETSVPTDSATQPSRPKYVDGQKELPNTGTEANASLAALGLLGALGGFGFLARKKKED